MCVHMCLCMCVCVCACVHVCLLLLDKSVYIGHEVFKNIIENFVEPTLSFIMFVTVFSLVILCVCETNIIIVFLYATTL